MFQRILVANRDARISEHLPADTDRLNPAKKPRTTFRAWIDSDPGTFSSYTQWLDRNHLSFGQILEHLGLEIDDVFGPGDRRTLR